MQNQPRKWWTEWFKVLWASDLLFNKSAAHHAVTRATHFRSSLLPTEMDVQNPLKSVRAFCVLIIFVVVVVFFNGLRTALFLKP